MKYISVKEKNNLSSEEVKKNNQNYINTKLIELKDYFDNMYKGIDDNVLLDKEQRIAILTDEDYNLIVAGAGSGKTTTMAAKVKYLVEINNVDPKDIILISYTNKAVSELKKRINIDFKIPVTVCTFHKFGVDILLKQTDEKIKVLSDNYNVIKDYFEKELCNDNEKLKEFLKFFVFYFDIPNFALKFDSLNSFLNYKKRNDYITLKSRLGDYNKQVILERSNKRYTILGEFLKSTEEVMIANFLYLNGIDYEYEKPYPKMDRSKTYLPDFTIYQGERVLYLEHFGIDKKGYNTLYSRLDNLKYKYNINNKRKIHSLNNTTLIETYSSPDLLENLKNKLIENKIILSPKSEKEVYSKLVDTSKDTYYTRFIIFCMQFIQNFKVKGYEKEDFAKLKKQNNDERTIMFLDFIEKVYDYYQQQLKIHHYIDFEDMINDAYKKLDNIKLNYKYIIIDEYQDISRQRFNLAKKISDVSNAKITAVGDDWQSIFAFAGSEIDLFTDFKTLMGYATLLKITNTYRNSQELINIAGNFIMSNKRQIIKKLNSPKKIKDPIIVLAYDNNSNRLKNKIEMFNLCLKDITKYKNDAKVLLIGRYNFEKYFIENSESFELTQNEIKSKCFPSLKIDFLSAHSSKGLGYDYVIILNGDDGTYGFPSQIKDDPIMRLVNYYDDSYLYAEERRLFYVALTRTKNKTYILTPVSNPSDFVLELVKYDGVKLYNKTGIKLSKKTIKCPKCGYPLIRKYNSLKISNLYICSNEKELCQFKTNNLKYLINIKPCPECNGELIVKKSKKNSCFLGCTNYDKGCNHTEKLF